MSKCAEYYTTTSPRCSEQLGKSSSTIHFSSLPYPNCELANQKLCLLSLFSTISSHWPDILRYRGQFLNWTRTLFADFRHENYNRNTTKRKTITFVKRESNLCNANREKKYNFLAKIGRGHTGGGSHASLRTALRLFCFQLEPYFPIFSLNLDF